MVTIIFLHIVMAIIAAALAAAIVVGVMLGFVTIETIFLHWPFLIGICAAWFAALIIGMSLPYGFTTVLTVIIAVWGVYWLVNRSRMTWKV